MFIKLVCSFVNFWFASDISGLFQLVFLTKIGVWMSVEGVFTLTSGWGVLVLIWVFDRVSFLFWFLVAV